VPMELWQLALPAPIVLPPTATGHHVDQAVTDQHPMNRDPRRHPAGTATTAQLELDPPSPPPRMSTTQLTDRCFHLRWRLARTTTWTTRSTRQTVQALIAIPTDPAMHRLPRHPNRSATSVTEIPAWTSSTARYRCSVMVNSTSTRRSVTQVLIPMCHAGPETGHGSRWRVKLQLIRYGLTSRDV